MRRIVRKPKKLNAVPLGAGIPSLHSMRIEIDNMVDVLLGREASPIDVGVISMLEVADAYYGRGQEWNILIHRMEADKLIPRGHKLYLFRTGELRDFLEIAKHAAEKGSRRLTAEQIRIQQELTGREFAGG